MTPDRPADPLDPHAARSPEAWATDWYLPPDADDDPPAAPVPARPKPKRPAPAAAAHPAAGVWLD